MKHHRLSSAQLDDIARGRPGPDAIRVLLAADDSGHRLLAAHAMERAGIRDRSVLDALAVLDEAQRRDEEAVADLSRTGWVGPWAARLLDRPDEAAQIIPLAAVAALRTGVRARLTARVLDGRLHLPALGTLSVPATGAEAVLEAGDGLLVDVAGARLRLPAPRSRVWSPVRSVTGDGLQLLVDDQHPGRDCFQMPPAGPLPDAVFDRWHTVITEAWGLLTTFAPELAGQVGRGLRVVVPLAPAPHGADTSVSCTDALGAVATTTPADGVAFAITLAHEWSHSLLNGLLNFVRLHHRESRERFFAPWRPDPRPLGGTLHGTFAFLAVAETWRALCADRVVRARAETEFALCRLQLGEVLTTLPGSPGLTEQGRRFVAVLRQRHAALQETPVSPAAAAGAAATLAQQRAAWTRRYGS